MKKPEPCIILDYDKPLRTLENTRLKEENTRLWIVISTFPSCSEMPVVFYHSLIKYSQSNFI